MFSMLFIFSSCASEKIQLLPENAQTDQSLLYGICYEYDVRAETGESFNIERDVKLLKNLGVTSMRLWVHATVYLSSPDTANKEKCDELHKIINAFNNVGITITAMSHTNFNSGSNVSGKPARNISEDSYYVKWLNDYYLSFKTLAREFPQITQWEIDNETNNTDFMKNTAGESLYDQDDMAEITADMLYYASRGMHEGNPDAKSVMGGAVGLYSGKIQTFLQKLYEKIKSGEFGYFYGQEDKNQASKNPDDYFEIACWHPYVDGVFSKKVFKQKNDDIYKVILENEGKHKKVIFSEVGFSNQTFKENVSAKYITQMFEVITQEMPYVESLHYFKLFDYADAQKYWTKTISRYGLLYDPDASRKYNNNETSDVVIAGNAKPAAYAFQQAAGGNGQLNYYDITIN